MYNFCLFTSTTGFLYLEEFYDIKNLKARPFFVVKKLTTIIKRPRLALQDGLALGLDSELEVSKQNIADEEKKFTENVLEQN